MRVLLLLDTPVFPEHADGSTEGSYEYLIFFNVLLQIAREYRLFPVLGYGRAQSAFMMVPLPFFCLFVCLLLGACPPLCTCDTQH